LYGINTIICFKKYRKILFDETLYGYITIPYFKVKENTVWLRNHHMCQGYPLATQLK
jgi:hypothetical protein